MLPYKNIFTRTLFLILLISNQSFSETDDCVQKAPAGLDLLEGTGMAVDNSSGDFLYCEIHTARDDNHKIIYYLDQSGAIFAGKSVQSADNNATPNVSQVNYASGEERHTQKEGDEFKLSFKQFKTHELKTTRLNFDAIDVVDAGFDAWIKQNWKALQQKPTNILFASPPHQKAFSMTVKKQTSCSKLIESLPESRALPQQPEHCFSIKIKNRLLALIAPAIKLGYNADKELLIFKGITNLASVDGKPYNATIFYQHSPSLQSVVGTHNQ